MLRFNTFRAERYLRSKFSEGRYLLASELTDVELELFDLTSNIVKNTIGNVAIDDAWKVEKYTLTTTITNIVGSKIYIAYPYFNNTYNVLSVGDNVYLNGIFKASIITTTPASFEIQLSSTLGLTIGDTITIKTARCLLINKGEAFYEGIPFFFRDGYDPLIVLGKVHKDPAFPTPSIQLLNEPTGLGKLIYFESYVLPATNIRVVVAAKEDYVDNLEDPYLKNINISEATAQKVRMYYEINLVLESLQSETSNPYLGDKDAINGYNLSNRIAITPINSSSDGHLVSTTTVSGSEAIDGRNIEIGVQYNGVGILPSDVINDMPAFSNGKLIDNTGNVFHINTMFIEPSLNKMTIRLDTEVGLPSRAGQTNPVIEDGKTYYLVKKSVYYTTDDISGGSGTVTPEGVLYWPVARFFWNSGVAIKHGSSVVDLREKIYSQEQFQNSVNIKFDLRLASGGTIKYEGTNGSDMLSWGSAFTLTNPYGPTQTISASTAALLEGGSLVYLMNLESGGLLNKGNKSITVNSTSSGGTILFLAPISPPDLIELEAVSLGNIIRNSSGEIAQVTAVDDVQNIINISPGFANTGAATIYLDSYAPQTAPKDKDNFVLATRINNKIYLGPLELESGEETYLGDGVSSQLLTFIGATSEIDSQPNYTGQSTAHIVTQGSSLVQAISDTASFLQNMLDAPLYDERILYPKSTYPSGLAADTAITIPLNSRNGNAQETFVLSSGDLEVWVNGLFRIYSPADAANSHWYPIDNQTIAFKYALPPDTEIHLRKANFGGASATGSGGGGGGSGSLQDSYDNGNTIITLTSIPMSVNGTSGDTVLRVIQNLKVDGIIL